MIWGTKIKVPTKPLEWFFAFGPLFPTSPPMQGVYSPAPSIIKPDPYSMWQRLLVSSLKICYQTIYYLLITLRIKPHRLWNQAIARQRSWAASAKWSQDWELNFNSAKTEQLHCSQSPLPFRIPFHHQILNTFRWSAQPMIWGTKKPLEWFFCLHRSFGLLFPTFSPLYKAFTRTLIKTGIFPFSIAWILFARKRSKTWGECRKKALPRPQRVSCPRVHFP